MTTKYINGLLTKCKDGSTREVNVEYNFVDEDDTVKFKLSINTDWLDCETLSICPCCLSYALHDYNLR
jgi:hypothetical protein